MMSRFAGLALVLLALACGCGQPSSKPDPTSQALVHLHDHQYDDAIRSASEAIEQSPQNAPAYLYRGRAYYYRASMGDAHRAIEDLSQAIRLAPDSSDAYYVRALLYRELGQIDLADKDDARARELDHVSREVFDSLPDSTPGINLSKLKPPAADKTKAADKTAAEMLKESETRPASAKVTESPIDALPGSAETGLPAPVESEFNKQYRALLGKTAPGEASPLRPEAPVKDVFGRPLDGDDGTDGIDSSAANSTDPLPSSENAAQKPNRGAGTWSGTVPPLQSPFARQPSGMAAPTGMGALPGTPPRTQSPFPQATRGATGYVPPVSPFGGPGGRASGAAGVSRPFSTPSTNVRSQNSDIRPPNPRDYVP